VCVAAGKSLNDERMLRPADRRGCLATEQISLSVPVTSSLDMPPGLQQLLGKNASELKTATEVVLLLSLISACLTSSTLVL